MLVIKYSQLKNKIKSLKSAIKIKCKKDECEVVCFRDPHITSDYFTDKLTITIWYTYKGDGKVRGGQSFMKLTVKGTFN